MTDSAFGEEGVGRLGEVMAGHVVSGAVPGLAWVVGRRGETRVGVAGTFERGGEGAPVERETIFRVSSMTKPVTAVGALVLVEDGTLGLDEPVDRWLPELADRRVMADPHGDLADTVPADRPITPRHLLTSTFGIGFDFAADGPQPVIGAIAELGLGVGPPAPQGPPAPDEWIRRLGTLPLERQPGERWQYHMALAVLGVLVARAAGQPFDAFLRERVFEPIGMVDTGFWVPPDKRDRFGPCFLADGSGYDPADGQWATPPAYLGGGDGLVSTIDDWARFARMLLDGGGPVLSPASVTAMTTNQLTDEQLAAASPDPTGGTGWGFGVGVALDDRDPARPEGSYGWDGGLGSTWGNDPAGPSFAILLTNQAAMSPAPPRHVQDFWAAVAATGVASAT